MCWIRDVSFCAWTYFHYFHFLPLRSITSDSQRYTCGCLSLSLYLPLLCGLQATLTPSNRPSCITFILHPHCTIIHLSHTHSASIFARSFTHIISFTFFLTIFLSVPHILSVSSPSPSSRPLRGRGDFAFVCDRRVNGAQGWGEILGVCPKL